MRIVQLVLVGVLAAASVAIAVGVFFVGADLVDATSEQNQLLADIQSELSAQTRDTVMLSVMNRWAVCDLVGVTADNSGNSANDEFYDQRFWCFENGASPWIEAWDITKFDDIARYGWGQGDTESDG